MRGKALLGALVGAVLVLATGCASSSQEQKAYAPQIDPAEFTTKIDNEYFPLKPGTTFVHEGGKEHSEMSVTSETKKVMGVECVVVDHKEWEGDKLIEKTYDWFAQDKEGNGLVLRGGHQGVRKRQGHDHKRLVGGWGRRSQAGDHHASPS